MKKTLFIIAILVLALNSYADTYYFAWYGYGGAARHNYSLGYGYGSYQYKGVGKGVGLGQMEINQNYDLYYDREMGGAVGSTVRVKLNYYFLCPMVVFQLGKTGQTQCYVTGGVGYAQGGGVELHKWSSLAWSSGGIYDSTIDMSKSVNKYVLRLGFGFVQFYHLGGNFHLFINQDIGFPTSSVLNVSDPDVMNLNTNSSQLFRPLYFSLRVGLAFITHSRDNDTPYRIHSMNPRD